MSTEQATASKAMQTASAASGMPLGTVIAYALPEDSIPYGWVLCDGRKINEAYPDLIMALQSEHAPDLRGRTLLGGGTPLNDAQSDGTTPNFESDQTFELRENGGEAMHKLTISEMPAHKHHMSSRTGSGTSNDYANNWSDSTPLEGAFETSSAGGNASHNTLQPYFVVNYIIRAIS